MNKSVPRVIIQICLVQVSDFRMFQALHFQRMDVTSKVCANIPKSEKCPYQNDADPKQCSHISFVCLFYLLFYLMT